MSSRNVAAAVCALLFSLSSLFARELENTFQNPGAPVQDRIFLQEIGSQVPSKTPLTAVAAFGESIFAGSAEGLFQLSSNTLAKIEQVTVPVRRLSVAGGALWAFSTDRAYRFDGRNWLAFQKPNATDAALFASNVIVSAGSQLFGFRDNQLLPFTQNQPSMPAERMAVFNDTLYLLGANKVTFFDGLQFGGRDLYDFPSDLAWDWGAMPSPSVRDMLAAGPCLYFATGRGLGVLRGMSLTSIRGEQGLPHEDLTCLARGFTNDLWIGSSRGLIRKLGDEFHYFAGQRWLPSDQVRAIAVAGRTVYAATDAGLGIVTYQPLTLEEKAAFYENHMEAWGQKRLGFVYKLEWDEPLQEYVREVSDNDGGFSADYLAAQSFRYAVTQEPRVRQEAVNTFKSLLWLERITGIPGFPARSIWAKGERGHKAMGGSGGYPAEWHEAPGTPFEWKADTSSDEICGHYFGVSLFLELAAEGEEIRESKIHLARLASHLIDRGWRLIDRDGKPTRWGRWDPEYFRTDEGRHDRGLQSVELLSFMKTASHFTGEPKFSAAYNQLIGLGYPAYTLRQKNVFPRDSVANFDDQLAFWSFWNLLRRETNPVLRSAYRRSFERTWEILRVEQQPFFNFIYGALTGNECEAEQGARHLREWPLDLIGGIL